MNGETWRRLSVSKTTRPPCPPSAVGQEDVRQPLAERVAHLGDDAGERAVAAPAPPERDRVEDVAEHAEVRQHLDRAALAELDPVLCERRVDVDVVAVVEARHGTPVPAEEAQAPVERGQLVEVDEGHVDRVAEDVVARRAARVHDGAGVERAPHHAAPNAAAARRPEASPSSWKPLPCQAPAKAVRRSAPCAACTLRRREARERDARMLVRDDADHRRRLDLVRAIQRDAVLDRRFELLQAVEGVGERRRWRHRSPQPGDW